jgi:hypothetical protein
MKSQQQKKADALRKAVEALGLDPASIALPVESHEDRMVQAQAVLHYFTSNGDGFLLETCTGCGEVFAYNYRIKGVKQCSVQCMKKAMNEIGLVWHPDRPPAQRWGPTVPAIVPPQALALLRQENNSHTDQNQYTSSE